MSGFCYNSFPFEIDKEFTDLVGREATALSKTTQVHRVFEFKNINVVVTMNGVDQFSVDPWDGTYWAGCNRWVNQGKNEYEPVGTATSMHDCGGCERLVECSIKQLVPVWEWTDGIEEQMEQEWRSMNQ